MKDIYNEEEVEKVAQKVVDNVKEKVSGQILDEVYNSMSSYLYEHYSNNKNNIEGELIKSIAEEYVKNPTEYKYAKLRDKMFLEHKEELTKVLTDEAIQKSVEKVIQEYTHRDYHFNWQWKEGIAKFILNNFHLIKDDERINEWIGRDLKRKQERIESLEEQLREIEDLATT